MTRILTVCTGNICRSPAAELLLAHALGPDAVVTSAGTYAMSGHGIPAPMLLALDGDSIEGRGHVARQYNAQMARDNELVISMAAEHRSYAVSAAPFAMRKMFLLSELATAARDEVPLEGADAASRLASVAEAVSDYRPHLAGRGMEDVPDPYQRSQRHYDESYAMIKAAVEDIAAWVRG